MLKGLLILKSDHIGIEIWLGGCGDSPEQGLKSDHIGIEIG